jgi:hypothetical protein
VLLEVIAGSLGAELLSPMALSEELDRRQRQAGHCHSELPPRVASVQRLSNMLVIWCTVPGWCFKAAIEANPSQCAPRALKPAG